MTALLPLALAVTVSGDPFEGMVPRDVEAHAAPAEATLRQSLQWRGAAIEVAADDAGRRVITLESPDFDAYLVLEDVHGSVLAEDDDGYFGTNARLEADLAEGQRLVVLAPEGYGEFTLTVHDEAPDRPTPAQALARAEDALAVSDERDREDLRTAHAHAAVAVAAYAAGASEDAAVGAEQSADLFAAALADHEFRKWEQVSAAYRKSCVDGEGLTQLESAAIAYFEAGEHDSARRLCELSLANRLAAHGEMHPTTALWIHNLALAQSNLGRSVDAARLYERAMGIRLEVLGERNAATAQTIHYLASVRKSLGEFERAEPLYERALAIRRDLFGEVHAETASSLVRLAHTLERLGEPGEAVRLYERGLSIQLELFGEVHSSLPFTLGGLSIAHSRLGEQEDAIRVGERGLSVRLALSGEMHASTAEFCNNLGHFHRLSGNPRRAVEWTRRGVSILTRLMGGDHPDVARAHHNLVLALRDLGELEESLRMTERSVSIFREAFGDHPETADAWNELGRAHQEFGDHANGLACFERSLSIRESVLGARHPDTAQALSNVASALLGLRRLDEALQFAERSVSVYEDRAELGNALAIHALGVLKGILIELGGANDGRLMAVNRRMASIDVNELLATTTDADSLITVARSREELGDFEEAARLYARATVRPRDAEGRHHSFAGAWSLDRLVPLLVRLDRFDEAEQVLMERHEALVAAYGETDARCAVGHARLAVLYWRHGDRSAAEDRFEEAVRLGDWESASTAHENEYLLEDLAAAALDLGRLEQAASLSSLACSLRDRFHPGERPTLDQHQRLGGLLLDLGRFVEAEREFGLVLEQSTWLSEGNPLLLSARFGRARALMGQSRFAEAQRQLAALRATQERALPDDHEDLQETRLRLAEALRRQGRLADADAVQATITDATVYRPVMLVQSPAGIATETEQRGVTLRAVLTDYVGIADVQIVRDGVASLVTDQEKGDGARRFLEHDPSGQKSTLTYPLRFYDGQTEMSVVVRAQNRRGQWSDPQTFRITYAPPQRELYLLAMGVADYDDDALDLQFPVKDVDDMIAAMKRQEGGFYSKVHVQRLADGEVTIGKAKRALDRFLVNAQPRDTIVVFVAGHGIRTEHEEYFFLTPGTTPDEPYDGIDRSTIESLVLSKKLNAKRRVLLLDTCHAGGLDGSTRGAGVRSLLKQDEVNAFGADQDATGTYILASSTDTAFAHEADGNGLFTRSFIDGLSGAADAAPLGNGNGFVEIDELKSHVFYDVLERSMGRQRTTVPKVISGENFPLGRVGGGS